MAERLPLSLGLCITTLKLSPRVDVELQARRDPPQLLNHEYFVEITWHPYPTG